MLDIINGLDEAAWAGLAALGTAVLGALGAAWRGLRKEPAVPVLPPPPPVCQQTTDLDPYILTELRELNRKHDDGTRIVDARFDEVMRLLGRLYTDTQVIRDRH